MKYADLRKALYNCCGEQMFVAFIYDPRYTPFGNFYGLAKIIAEDVFLLGEDYYDKNDLSFIRALLKEIRKNGWADFEDKEEYKK